MDDLIRPGAAMVSVASQTSAAEGWPWWALWVQTAVGGIAVYGFLLATLLSPSSPSDGPAEYDGILSIIGAGILLAAVGFAVVVIVSIVTLLGLPIRLMPRVRRWVAQHPLVPGAVAAVGAALWAVSLVVRPLGLGGDAPLFTTIGCALGCFLLAFGLVHLWFPGRPAHYESRASLALGRQGVTSPSTLVDSVTSDSGARERRVVRADSAAATELEGQGWVVIARSWGAGLVVGRNDFVRLRTLVERARPLVHVRELGPADVNAVLALDRETANDYPGDVATAHAPLTLDTATPSAAHRGWGGFTADHQLVAMTFADVGQDTVETHFTVVRRDRRGHGLGAAVKAASVLALAAEGHTIFRTGGSAANPASIATSQSVGYELDEEWLTLIHQARAPHAIS